MAGAHTISDSGSSEEEDRNAVSIANQLKISTADSKKVVSKAVGKTRPTKIAPFSVAKFIDDCSSSDEEGVTKLSKPSALSSTIVSSKKTSLKTSGNSRTVIGGGSANSGIGSVTNSEKPKTKVSASQKRTLAEISDEGATDIDEEMVEKLEARWRNKKSRVESKSDVTNNLSQSHTLSDSDDDLTNYSKQHEFAKKTITPSKSKSVDSISGGAPNHSTSLTSCKRSKQSPTLLTPSPTPKATSKCGSSSSTTTPQSTLSPSSRPPCRYGLTCYRQKQAHWNKASHPDEKCENGKGGKLIWTRPNLSLSSSQKNSTFRDDDFDDDDEDMLASLADDAMDKPSSLNSSWTNPSLIQVLSDAEPHNYFLTKVSGIDDRFNASHALSMKDILSPLLGTLESSVQFNYCIDINWMMSQYPPQCRQLPVLVIHGLSREAKAELAAQAENFSPHVRLAQAKLPDPFGTHHTKMMILKYQEGLRVAITTANLIAHDWAQKTQGIWLSPLFPRLDESCRGESAGDSKTCFKKDLLTYLRAYRLPQLKPIEDMIQAHDLSSCKVFLLGSIPGRHQGMERTKWGHMRLRRILEEHQVAPSKPKSTPTLNMTSKTDVDTVGKSWYLLAQFSSVGSLGNAASQWLQAEFSASLSSLNSRGGDPSAKGPFNPLANAASSSKFRLVFPTVEDVGNSLEGYQAGTSIPYARATASKQPWLKSLMHRWRADGRGRTRAAPHIKSFAQIDPSSSKIAWFASTSANLSKAAWGALEKNQSQLFIRSYELGVLFLPQYFEDDKDGNGSYFCVKRVMETGSGRGLAFPLDLPLTPYAQYDEPWLWDANHTKKLDSHGCTWEPNKQSR